VTDQHEPERRTPPDRGLPTAGRRPDPAAGVPPEAPEPSEASEIGPAEAPEIGPETGPETGPERGGPPADRRVGERGAGEGPTVPMRRPARPAAGDADAGDEPTVITPPPATPPALLPATRPTPPAATTPPGEERTPATPWRGLADDKTTRLSPPPAWPARPPAAGDAKGAESTQGAAEVHGAEAHGAGGDEATVSGELKAPVPPGRAGTGRNGSPADIQDRSDTGLSPVTGEEPAVRAPLPAAGPVPDDDDGETRRLQPPVVVPGPAGEPKPAMTSGPAGPGMPAAAGTPGEASDADGGPNVTPVPVRGAGASDGTAEGDPGETGPRVGSLDAVISGADSATPSAGESPPVPENGVGGKKKGRLSSAGVLIWVVLALFGFTLVVQLRSNNADDGLATARQEDLVRILSDLEARDQRLQTEINALETSQRQLTSGVEGRQAALAEAQKRADELGLLAGTLPGRGPGLRIVIDPRGDQVKASAVLNAVQELRGAGGEVMEIVGTNGTAVRIVASTYFIDGDAGGIQVDGQPLTGPWTLWVIGVPETMQTALQIPGGVVASVNGDGGSVTMEPRSMVEVTAVRKATSLQYARPVS
jgi:uncharacterized protein YlxW (UPF0749 family)